MMKEPKNCKFVRLVLFDISMSHKENEKLYKKLITEVWNI